MDIKVNLGQNKPTLIKTIKQALEIVQGLTSTSKMPSSSYSLPAKACVKGAKLRQIEGSVCAGCYALKGNYKRYPAIVQAQERRLKALDNPDWVNAMVYLLNNKKDIVNAGVFRWHDSGDLQNVQHLGKILQVVLETPHLKHWLPTKESHLIKKMGISTPNNLVIRLSGTMVNGKAPKYANTSTVTTNPELATCRSFENDGQCGDCRKCWDKEVKNVTYLAH